MQIDQCNTPHWQKKGLKNHMILSIESEKVTLTGIAQLVGCCPAEWKAPGLIPGEGTCLGCGPASR